MTAFTENIIGYVFDYAVLYTEKEGEAGSGENQLGLILMVTL